MKTAQDFIDAEKKHSVSREKTIEILNDKIKVARQDYSNSDFMVKSLEKQISELKALQNEHVEKRYSYDMLSSKLAGIKMQLS